MTMTVTSSNLNQFFAARLQPSEGVSAAHADLLSLSCILSKQLRNTNRKAYESFRLVPLTLSDPKLHFNFQGFNEETVSGLSATAELLVNLRLLLERAQTLPPWVR